MSLQTGIRMPLLVAREVSPNGYFLTNGEQDVLLHYSEVVGEIKVGEQVEVFLFHDSEDRLAATMRKPLVMLGELALLEVADIHPRLGCFLEFGLGRQLLLPRSELPELPELHPRIGDRVYIVMGHDKRGRLLARAAGERDFEKLIFPAPQAWVNRVVDCRVYKTLQMGSFVVCDGGPVGFGVLGLIHEKERARKLRLGETVQARVAVVREDGRVNLTMRQRKEVGRVEDSERILDFLKSRPNGSMPYSDETPADIVQQRFEISKSAFKRALGKLMKEGHIVQKGSWTYLKEAVPDQKE